METHLFSKQSDKEPAEMNLASVFHEHINNCMYLVFSLIHPMHRPPFGHLHCCQWQPSLSSYLILLFPYSHILPSNTLLSKCYNTKQSARQINLQANPSNLSVQPHHDSAALFYRKLGGAVTLINFL